METPLGIPLLLLRLPPLLLLLLLLLWWPILQRLLWAIIMQAPWSRKQDMRHACMGDIHLRRCFCDRHAAAACRVGIRIMVRPTGGEEGAAG